MPTVEVYEEIIVPDMVWRFIQRFPFPGSGLFGFISTPLMDANKKQQLRDLVTNLHGPIFASQFDVDVKRFLSMCNTDGGASEAFHTLTEQQRLDYGFALPHAMTVLKLADGRLICHSPIDPASKLPDGTTVLDRIAHIGSPSFVLEACLTHNAGIKPFIEAYPDACLVTSSGFMNATYRQGPNSVGILPSDTPKYVLRPPHVTEGRDDTEQFKAAVNHEIEIHHILTFNEEMAFIHTPSSVMMSGDLFYSTGKTPAEGGFAAKPWGCYPPARDFNSIQFSQEHLAARLWNITHICSSANGLMADYRFDLQCDFTGFISATGLGYPAYFGEIPVKHLLSEGWRSIERVASANWKISLASHHAAQWKEEATQSLYCQWRWLQTITPLAFGTLYPQQPLTKDEHKDTFLFPRCC